MKKLSIYFIQEDTNLSDLIINNLPEGKFNRVFIKPNWVKHQENDIFPINSLVTDTDLIDLTIQACLKKYINLEKICIGDVPLQICDWELLVNQTKVNNLIRKYKNYNKPEILFLDLRRERYKLINGFLEFDGSHNGDQEGYSEIILDEASMLEEISSNSANFRVSDYDPKETISMHKQSYHRYLIAKTILKSDLIINMPKMKTHQKSGITGALKNLVGINGSKAYLVHHQKGLPSQGGDEFPDNISRILLLQSKIRETLQKRSKVIFKILKFNWEILKKIFGIKTVGTKENLNKKSFYIGSGSWYGNDSIWRMVYDLNMIILFGNKDGGKLKKDKQREYFCILDGITSGEGNGPLQPLPVYSNVIAFSQNPFLVDFAIAKMMGFDYKKIPLLNNYKRFSYKEWTKFTPENFNFEINTKLYANGINSIPIIKFFLPPPGWKDHIELTL
jgi:hypothetical protein